VAVIVSLMWCYVVFFYSFAFVLLSYLSFLTLVSVVFGTSDSDFLFPFVHLFSICTVHASLVALF